MQNIALPNQIASNLPTHLEVKLLLVLLWILRVHPEPLAGKRLQLQPTPKV